MAELTQARKNTILNGLLNLTPKIAYSFASFTPQEKEFIISLLEKQDGSKGFDIETNGHSSKPETITKFRKTEYWWLKPKLYDKKPIRHFGLE